MVYVTNSNYENATLILHDDTSVIKNAQNYNFLPPVFSGFGVHYKEKVRYCVIASI